MTNYNGTLLRIVGIFLQLVAFWLFLSFIIVLLLSLFGVTAIIVTETLWVFLIIMTIRVVYPRFIFTP